ncbi:MAG: tRNA 2-thiocytidine biosynthesis TtcA family protein [Deltaproteobacteria bacterium]|nr:tRNA 2-thiocytidine biosynthesis TtcA family protein [Deltaproteobacteria bacterium]
MAYLESQIKSLVGQAVHGWRQIKNGDRVAVGLSGGKDSLTMLKMLAERRARVPIDYHLEALHIEMGYGAVDLAALAEFCRGLGVNFHVFHSDFGPRAHSPENRKNSPCFFCTLHRRKELFILADQLSCNKLALAHHQDDIHETLLMNLFYAGNLATMLPVQPLFHGRLTIIRPLSLVTADQCRRFAARQGLPVQPPCCPSAGHTKRAEVGALLESLYRGNKKVRPNLWHALTHAGLASLPPPPFRGKRD